MCSDITIDIESSKISQETISRECENAYNLINSLEHFKQCKAFGFNKSNDIWVLGSGFEILVCEYQNETLRVEQVLQGHQSCVSNILYSNKEDMFFSVGSWDDNVIVWRRDQKRKWNKQYLNYKVDQTRDFEIIQLILNEDEDELIGVMDYNFLIVWKKGLQNQWENSQVISISKNELSQILQVSYDKEFKKIITITLNGQVQILSKNLQEQWKKQQSIYLKALKGKKFYNRDIDSLILQCQNAEFLLFHFNKENELYEECHVKIPSSTKTQLYQFIESNFQTSQIQEIYALQKEKQLQILKMDERKQYQKIQTIQFEQNFFYQFTKNNQYLITWDYSKCLKIWKQKND
ncbi:unnamed protein product [Paramecium sonneborni]|uniref:WD40-repeat-containing domain n=1 Tax=Paramecium sonneborni TaxID=65129 RepID=A0A8S1KST1_9CILI|nr:unnamed protein product [Paramecium sonneborni]